MAELVVGAVTAVTLIVELGTSCLAPPPGPPRSRSTFGPLFSGGGANDGLKRAVPLDVPCGSDDNGMLAMRPVGER